jgi:hypothetical protein
VRIPRGASILAALAVAAASLLTFEGSVGAASNATSTQQVTTIELKPAKAYQPKAQPGTTDDYHCTLMDPHVTRNSFITSSQFFPGSNEDHHAALFLVPPSIAAIARKHHSIGTTWTCFGEAALPGTTLAQFLQSPFLSVWAPGHGADTLPKGTGIPLLAGSLVIEQVHYNLLVGHKPVTDRLVLHTVPATAAVLPLHLDLMLAPPDVPCPANVTGPLCDRAAALANQGKRFGSNAVDYVNGIEELCGNDPAAPPVGNSTSCTSTVGSSGYIVRSQVHMHLLGTSFTMVLNPGTPQAVTVLDVAHYNFHNQKAYTPTSPIPIHAGDTIRITCTYDAQLAQELPSLRKVQPHFVTWGDGSSDEMCIGLAWTAKVLPPR